MTIQTIDSPVVDFATVKARQQAAWASGDYAVVGTTLQIVGEMLCEAVDLRGGQRVLDVAAGNGNAKLAAARRFAEVTSTDYVAALLERGRERAEAERLPMTFRQADAEDLPFADGSFDVVLFDLRRDVHARPCQGGARAAARVPTGRQDRSRQLDARQLHRPGVQLIGKYVPPAPGLVSPRCGASARISRNCSAARPRSLRRHGSSPSATARRRISPRCSAPIAARSTRPSAIGSEAGGALECDLLALLDEFNTARDGTLVIPSTYLEVVATRV